ncbi:hypothetical protein ACIQRC_33285 [Streptomyces californicus]|uniref:hypothetical protein n=1 Tax=Streptomyces californicus TaxID=67351 RepID=UPI00380937E4
MVEVKPRTLPSLQDLGASILPRELSAFHDAHRLDFIQYARIKHVRYEDAEDVVSKTFLTLYRAGQSFLNASNPTAFAFRARNTILLNRPGWP